MTENKDLFEHLCRFAKIKLGCGKSLIELTLYRGIYLWWFVDFDFRGFFINQLKSKNSNRATHPNRVLYEFYLLFRGCIEVLFDAISKVSIQLITKIYGGGKVKDYENKLPKILFTAQDVEWKIVRDYELNTLKKSDAFLTQP